MDKQAKMNSISLTGNEVERFRKELEELDRRESYYDFIHDDGHLSTVLLNQDIHLFMKDDRKKEDLIRKLTTEEIQELYDRIEEITIKYGLKEAGGTVIRKCFAAGNIDYPAIDSILPPVSRRGLQRKELRDSLVEEIVDLYHEKKKGKENKKMRR